jgi:hypothetical protein
MSGTLQSYLATATPKAATDLEAALMRLPEEKRNWKAEGKARTALDMVAEVAILNGETANIIVNRAFDKDYDMAGFQKAKDNLGQDLDALLKTLHENTAKVVAEIEKLSDDDLNISINMPWGPMTLAQVASYPFWNACYHEGQINFIASMFDLLD